MGKTSLPRQQHQRPHQQRGARLVLVRAADPHSPARMHVPITAHVPENIIMADPQKKPATDEDMTAEGRQQGGQEVTTVQCRWGVFGGGGTQGVCALVCVQEPPVIQHIPVTKYTPSPTQAISRVRPPSTLRAVLSAESPSRATPAKPCTHNDDDTIKKDPDIRTSGADRAAMVTSTSSQLRFGSPSIAGESGAYSAANTQWPGPLEPRIWQWMHAAASRLHP